PSAPVARFDAAPAPTAALVTPAGGASPVASGRPASSAGAAPGLQDLDAAALRSRLRDFTNTRDWARAGKALEALAKADPAALHEAAIASAAASVAVALETTGGEDADAVWNLLSARAGVPGLEVLFEIVRGRGGTKASKRAAAILREPEVL